jgi:hypothetical protein
MLFVYTNVPPRVGKKSGTISFHFLLAVSHIQDTAELADWETKDEYSHLLNRFWSSTF